MKLLKKLWGPSVRRELERTIADLGEYLDTSYKREQRLEHRLHSACKRSSKLQAELDIVNRSVQQASSIVEGLADAGYPVDRFAVMKVSNVCPDARVVQMPVFHGPISFRRDGPYYSEGLSSRELRMERYTAHFTLGFDLSPAIPPRVQAESIAHSMLPTLTDSIEERLKEVA